jgi:hypothetical protein
MRHVRLVSGLTKRCSRRAVHQKHSSWGVLVETGVKLRGPQLTLNALECCKIPECSDCNGPEIGLHRSAVANSGKESRVSQ